MNRTTSDGLGVFRGMLTVLGAWAIVVLGWLLLQAL